MTGLLNQICCFWTHRHREQAGVARGEGPGGLGEGGGTKKSELSSCTAVTGVSSAAWGVSQ